MSDDYDVQLLVSVAVDLDSRGIGVWRPDSPYEDAERAITLDGLPQQRSAITLSAYTLEDGTEDANNTTGLQVICREPGTDSTAARNTATSVFRALHGRTEWRTSTGLWVLDIFRRSHVTGGEDQNGDHSVIQNFHARLHAPTEETP